MHHWRAIYHQKERHLFTLSDLLNDGWGLKYKNGRLCDLHEICSKDTLLHCYGVL